MQYGRRRGTLWNTTQEGGDNDKGMVRLGNEALTDKTKLKELTDLQKRLLRIGFMLTKPGGVVVYSTCSLSTEQNKNVVSWLLAENSDVFFNVSYLDGSGVLPSI